MSLIQQYEQQYAVIIAEVTAHMGRLNLYAGGSVDRKDLCKNIETSLPEAKELLEQIGLEIRDVPHELRPSLLNKMKCHEAELKRLQAEYKKIKENIKDPLDDDFDDIGINDDQTQKLLDNSERIERTGNHLAEGYKIVLETEEIGTQILKDLHHQRETINSARSKMRETNTDLSLSRRILNSIFLRIIREKAILYAVGIFFLIVISLGIHFSISNK